MAKKNGNGKGGTLVKVADYEMMHAGEEVRAALRENLGGQSISAFELDRVKIPAGGATNWAIPQLDGDETSAKEVRGIIVYWQDKRVYWKDSYEDSGGGSPPDCFSDDLERGIGTPGGDCDACPFSKFESARDGEGAGQACSQRRMMFILRSDQLMPLVIALPPGSLKSAKKYFLGLASKAIRYWTTETVIKLEKATNKGGLEFSRATFSQGKMLDEEARTQVTKYVEDFGDAFKATQLAADDMD